VTIDVFPQIVQVLLIYYSYKWFLNFRQVFMVLDSLFSIIIILFSVVIHEISHGAVANSLGDPTARLSGRLTLNPVKHIDPLGSIIVPVVSYLMFRAPFGWAKPVPINPYNLRDQKWGVAKVAVAGSGANLLIALFFGLLIRFFPVVSNDFFSGMNAFFLKVVWINIVLGVFNLIPIPPFDGSKILFSFLPPAANAFKDFMERYGMVMVLFIIFFGVDFIILISSFILRIIVGPLGHL